MSGKKKNYEHGCLKLLKICFGIVDAVALAKPHPANAEMWNKAQGTKIPLILGFALFLLLPGSIKMGPT